MIIKIGEENGKSKHHDGLVLAWDCEILYFENIMNERTSKIALIISSLSSFMTPFMISSLNVALPSIGKEYSLDAIELSWIATSYLLSAAIFLIPFGRLADIYGRKKIFVYGVSVFSIFSVLVTFTHSAIVLILLRAFQGLGAAMIFGTGVAILLSVTSPHNRGKVLGINVASVYIGLSIGPFIGGMLTQYFGWQSIFYISALIGVIVVLLTIWKLEGEWAEAKGDKFDLTGALLFSIALFMLMYGFSKLSHAIGWYLTGGALFLLGIFLIREKRIQNPILNVSLFTKNTVFAMSNIAALINYSATSAITFLLSMYLQYIKGLTPKETGIVLVVQPIFMAVLSPIAGRMSDKIEPRVLASIGMTLTVIGLALFLAMTADSTILFIATNLIFLGIGFGLFSSPNQNAVMSSVPKEVYGIASATLGTMRLTGQMMSMGIVMLIFSLSIGKIQITPEYYPQFLDALRTAFLIFALLCSFGIYASLARGKIRA
jgi:EmrB/QacA subfamily drug resistance transporter